ncbi:amidase [Enterococcus sp. JM4C]|uniref:isochorismatase family protein n=1 Tax=Candidatus Enterococcus huntleyi TaxID=1857217 RepID=UPI001379EFD5|nr:isochorismatase family protein [Enterococcus sp. JM4C]KAF1295838.1 amidase [Enterococcus sp. JM4C]
MKTIGDALLVIDLQNGVCYTEDQIIHELPQVVTKVNQRITDYLNDERPIIFIRHSDEELIAGSEDWAIIPQIKTIGANVHFIEKTHANSFYQTGLKELLDQLAVSTLEICGAQSQYCVDTTVKFAHGLGYQLLMTHGTTTTYDTQYMTAEQTCEFYESIWNRRFVTFIDE